MSLPLLGLKFLQLHCKSHDDSALPWTALKEEVMQESEEGF